MDTVLATTYFWENAIWMGWNVVLAMVPYALSRWLFRRHTSASLVWAIGFILFMLFLPNTAYIITDVAHFKRAFRLFDHPLILALAAAQFIMLEVAGYLLFVESYARFEQYSMRSERWDRGFFRFVVFMIVSTGVTIGRLFRLNSWDALLAPHTFLSIFPKLLQPVNLSFVAIFTVILWILYGVHESFIRRRQ